jgi:Ca-activated chloride channel family protein
MVRASCHRLAAVVVVAGIALGGPARSAAQVIFKGGVDMVPLTVTVTNRTGHCVSGLTAENFAVFEDGIPQQVTLFASEPVPVDVAFVIDTSSSMASVLPLVRQAARGVIRSLGSDDRGAVIDVKGTIGMAQSLTHDQARIEHALGDLRPSGATAVYDGLYVVLRDFERDRTRHTEIRRQVVMLLSDGLDNISHVAADDVVDLARRLGVSIYVIALADPIYAAVLPALLDRSVLQAEYVIKALARDTGARLFQPTSVRELPGIYLALAEELASQYQIGYVPARPGGDGTFRRVSVRVLPPAAGTARTRSGYTASRRSAASLSAGAGSSETSAP